MPSQTLTIPRFGHDFISALVILPKDPADLLGWCKRGKWHALANLSNLTAATWWMSKRKNAIRSIRSWLVGGWTTHLKNISQNGNLSYNRDENKKIFESWNHHLDDCSILLGHLSALLSSFSSVIASIKFGVVAAIPNLPQNHQHRSTAPQTAMKQKELCSFKCAYQIVLPFGYGGVFARGLNHHVLPWFILTVPWKDREFMDKLHVQLEYG